MRKPTPRRNPAATVALMLVTFALGMTLAVLVAGSASAKSPPKTTKTTTKKTTTAKTATTQTPTIETPTPEVPDGPAAYFFVINGTVNAASDHEIVGSSAFPNFTTGAVDNYYSMAHTHVDNSPFAEGTASPADTGPIGQTAAAGQFQQPQYADARWPGDKDSGQATYGTKGQPYATAEAGEFKASADASEATNGLSGPGPSGAKTLALPKGFDLKLRQALGAWKGKWQGPLGLQKPARPKKPTPTVTTPIGTVSVPKVPVPKAPVPVPKAGVTPPAVTTPIATVTTPAPRPSVSGPAPPVTVTVPTSLPSAGAQGASRSLASLKKPPLKGSLQKPSPSAGSSGSSSGDGESLLTSSTSTTLVPGTGKCKKTDTSTSPTTATAAKGKTKTKTKTKSATPKPTTCKTYTLVTSGESSLGRVSLGGGQIVIEGIHVTASIANDGTPTYKAAVSVASATIGGVPVTIDQDGVHVNGQGGALPYQQASDALNAALKQAGIQLFLVGPEVTNNSCGQSGTGSGSDGGGSGGGSSGGSSTTTGSSDQSGMGNDTTSSCNQSGMTGTCDQSGSGTGTDTGTGTGPGLPTPPTPGSTDQTDTSAAPSSCGDQGTMCDQQGTGTGTGTTSTSATPLTPPSRTTTTTTTSGHQSGRTTTTSSNYQSDQSGQSSTTSSCGGSGSGFPSTMGSCSATGTGSGTPTTANNQSGTTSTSTDQTDTTMTGSSDQMGGGLNNFTSNQGEETVTATGVHVVFTQPVNQSGVPSQYVEHILGEVFVDSLAVPAGALPDLGFGSSSSGSFGSSSSSSFGPSSSGSSSSCAGGGAGGASSSGFATGGGSSSAGGSGALSSSGSGYGSGSQPGSSSTGTSLPAAFAAALRKPLWLLLAYLVWQGLVIGTGWSLWNWRRGEAS